MNRWALIDSITNIVLNVIVWDGEAQFDPPPETYLIESDTASVGWTYENGQFKAPDPEPPTDAEILASQSNKLQQATQLASSQKTALTNRVGTLNDAIELEMATPEEIAELPARTTQLTAWKKYAVLLGRVTSQPGWYSVVEWPAQPPEGMDLAVSAVGSRAATSL